MKKTTFGFTAFLRYFGLTPGQWATSLKQRKFRSGGFDAHEALKGGIFAVTHQGAKVLVERDKVAAWGKKTHAAANVAYFDRFAKWHAAEKVVPSAKIPPERVLVSPGGLVSVRLKPEIAIVSPGALFVMHVWATKQPPLTPFMLGVAWSLMHEAYKDPPFDQAQMAIRDLVFDTVWSESTISPKLKYTGVELLGHFESLWKMLENGSKGKLIEDQYPMLLGL